MARREILRTVLPATAVCIALVAVALALPAVSSARGLGRPAVHGVTESPAAVLSFWSFQRMQGARGDQVPSWAGRSAKSSRHRPRGHTRHTRGTRGGLPVPSFRGTPKPFLPPPSAIRWVGLELPWSSQGWGWARPNGAVGELFFTTAGGVGEVCSGTLVSANIVLTAAHCVRDGVTGDWSSNWMFVPAKNGGSEPYGRFAARTATVSDAWSTAPWNSVDGTGGQGYFPKDYAYVVLNPDGSGSNAGDYTGWYGILANAPGRPTDYHLGYPIEGPFRQFCAPDGCHPWACLSPIQRYDGYSGGGWDEGMSCVTSGGASGGPFFQNYNGHWYVASVLSHMGVVHPYADERLGYSFFGPYLNNDAISLFNYAETL